MPYGRFGTLKCCIYLVVGRLNTYGTILVLMTVLDPLEDFISVEISHDHANHG
jgi:hypothetical protein